MQYRSTRQGDPVGIEQAIMSGTAPGGGLYVPDSLPVFQAEDFGRGMHFADLACQLLTPFMAGSTLESPLADICHAALNFPVPLRRLEGDDAGLSVLEMFHGPTAAFKDVGARFLAGCMAQVIADGRYAQPPVTILVATSGDTGGAVASAYHGKPGVRVLVLFPAGRVSPRQQHQLTCWGDNVISLAIKGEFDDCQRVVKEIFGDPRLAAAHHLASANSINVGRLLPQAAYYAKSSLDHFHASGHRTSFVVPTGNLGNAFACVWARRFGMPIDRIVLATNANTTIPDFLATGQWLPRPSQPTLASAMDVGDPSNMERLRHLCGDVDDLRGEVSAITVSDDEIRASIRGEYDRHQLAWCPHTAAGFHAYRTLGEAERAGRHWVVVSTAHAAKFDTIVEPLLGITVAPPDELAALLQLPSRFATVDATLAAVAAYL